MIAFLFALVGTSHAIEFLPCQRTLGRPSVLDVGDERVVLAPDQVVVRGPIELYAEAGVGSFVTVTDLETRRIWSAHPGDWWHDLNDGDRVFVTNPSGSVWVRGHHSARRLDAPLDRRPTPALLVSPDDEARAIPDAEYRRYLERRADVVAVLTLPPARLKALDASIADKIEQRLEHQLDPGRMIPVGSGQYHERQIFERVIEGRARVANDRLVVMADGDVVALETGDVIYLVSESGEALGRLEGMDLIRPPAGRPNRLNEAARALVVRRTWRR